MQNKRPRPQSINNFVPSARSLDGMVARPRHQKPQRFPDVGMTMSQNRSAPIGSSSVRRSHVQHPHQTYAEQSGRRHKKQKVHKTRRWHWTKRKVVLLCLLPFILLALWLGIKFGMNAARIFNGNLFSVFSTTRLKGEDQGRVNILLAGNSADDVGHNGADLTDSIMILSLDVKNNRAFILSVPRDLYLPISGYGNAKINSAYVHGKRQQFSENGYPSGGMGLLEKTIATNLGVKVNYYALINYTALRDAVNAVGGVTVSVNGGARCGRLYDPSIDYVTHGPLVDLPNGNNKLNGQQALNLARARGDARGSCGYARSDFVRTENQRKLLLALKGKVFSTGVLANPVKLTKLFDSFGKNVKTDMQLGEVRRLNDLMKKVNDGKIKSYGLDSINGKNYLQSFSVPGVGSSLIPAAGLDNFTDIKQALRRLMSTSKVVQEDAAVVVLNGTPQTGLAAQNETLLSARNITVIKVGDATADTAKTYIIKVSKESKPATLKALKAVYGTQTTTTTTNPYAKIYKDADFIVVLGVDRQTT